MSRYPAFVRLGLIIGGAATLSACILLPLLGRDLYMIEIVAHGERTREDIRLAVQQALDLVPTDRPLHGDLACSYYVNAAQSQISSRAVLSVTQCMRGETGREASLEIILIGKVRDNPAGEAALNGLADRAQEVMASQLRRATISRTARWVGSP